MTRFVFCTLAAAIVFFSIGWFLHGSTRLWVYTGFWGIYLTMLGCGIAFLQLQFFGPVICQGSVAARRIALTFDDGPDPAVTPALLDLLAREKVPACFFCIGKNVVAHPQIAKRICNEGHLIANHTYHHSPWTAFFPHRQLKHEIELAQQAIIKAVGSTPAYMRPPIGLTNPHYHRALKDLGLTMMGWSVRSLDTLYSPQKVIARVRRNCRAGGIILLHDGNASPHHILQIVAALIHDLRADGFEFERLDHLITPPKKPFHFSGLMIKLFA